MKTILLILLTILVTACGGGGGGSTAALTGSNPAPNQFDLIGNYNVDKNSSTLIRTCSHGPTGWSCAYTAAQPPAACSSATTIMGSFRLNQDGTVIQTWGFIYNGHTYGGSPFIDWTAVQSAQMSYSNGTIYLPNQNYQFDIDTQGTLNQAVVTFSPGCSILFTRS